MNGVRLEVETHIVTAGAPALKNLRKAVNDVGINVEGLVFSGLASSEAVLSPTERELGCVLVDLGGGTTSIAVFIDGSLTFSSVIPVGAKNITNDLAIGLRVPLESAEKIKVVLSSGSNNKNKPKEAEDELDLNELGIEDVKKVSKKTLVEGIIRPRLNEIFTVVRIELEKTNLLNLVPSGVVITGGGAETIGITDSAKRMLSLPVRIGRPSKIGGLIDDIINPSFAVPVGLILFGAKETPDRKIDSLTKGFKLPSVGFAGKLVDIVKNLLP